MRKPAFWPWLVALGLLLGWFLTRPAGMAQSQPALPIGVVDMQRIVKEYQRLVQEDKAFKEFARNLEEDLRARLTVRLLSPPEQEEYLRLWKKGPQATAEEQKRLRELEEKAKQAERRLEELSQKPDPSPQEKQDLERLRKAALEAQGRLEQLQQEYQRQLEERNRTVSEQLDRNIRNAISFVAGAKNLPLVLDREAVLFGGVDITNEVLAELNK